MIDVSPSTRPPTTDLEPRLTPLPTDRSRGTRSVLIGCPDARPPAYQAVVGCARADALDSFLTAFYYGDGAPAAWARRVAPKPYTRLHRVLRRRHEPEIP